MSENNVFGDFISFRGKGYVAFIDILGFKRKIMTAFPSENDFREIEQVIAFNRRFAPDDLRGRSLKEKEPFFNGMARLFLFSDSYVICLQEGRMEGLSLTGIASHIRYIWNHLIKLGFTIRGGIDYCDAYWDERTVTGPALINAYEIESKVSICSRVVLSARVIEKIKEIENANPFKILLNKYFMPDETGEIILNPNTIANDDAERDELVSCLEKMRANAPTQYEKTKYDGIISALKKCIRH